MNKVDFFERQKKAKFVTRFFVCWFVLAILATAALIYLPFYYTGAENQLKIFLYVFCGTLLVIGLPSCFKALSLSRSSGTKVALDLGGTKVSSSTQDPAERRLLNVVNEMSLASGVPVPEVFVLYNEQSINAFAAGTTQKNAAIAVSAGALKKLSRDELQGVVGHEFSHILNGDMRLNVHLLSWIFGLFVISLIGQIIFRFAVYTPRSRNTKDDKSPTIMLIGLGSVIFIVGIISRFFGQIIQSAISRQREHLADASATQFTRNPKALADALCRIGGDELGSKINSPKAAEYAHFFFAKGLNSIFSSHPPLKTRIKLLNPKWDGNFLPPLQNNFLEEEIREIAGTTNAENAAGTTNFSALNAGAGTTNFSETSSAGTTNFSNFNKNVFSKFSETTTEILALSETEIGAKVLAFLILMSVDPASNLEQAKFLFKTESRETFKILEKNWPKISVLPLAKKIEAIEISAKTFERMLPREREFFAEKLVKIALADKKINEEEFKILSALEKAIAVKIF